MVYVDLKSCLTQRICVGYTLTAWKPVCVLLNEVSKRVNQNVVGILRRVKKLTNLTDLKCYLYGAIK
jgi:hypothetical protein